MQPQDTLTTNRRALDIEDYIDILRRHKAWILGPVFAALVVSVVVAFLWPDTYVSVAVIRVVPPQVPETLVATNTTGDLQGRINSLAQLILNRATLLNIINTKGLYKKELSRKPSDDVIEDMRAHDIKVVPLQLSLQQQSDRGPRYPAFEIQFSYNNRFTAQLVVQDLVARFLEENIREVSQQTVSTTQFLRDQWDQAKKKLDAIEQQLSVFRSKNMGHLPEEQQSNYSQLNAMQAQMLNLNTAMNRVNQEKLLFENQLRIYREQLSSMKDPVVQEQVFQQKNDKLAEKDREIAQPENSLLGLRERYKETHPDVQRMVSLLAAGKKQREAMAKEEETKKPDGPAAPVRQPNPQFVREQRDLEAQIQRMQGLIQAKDLEMDDYKKQAKDAEATIRSYQTRIEGIPVGIKEYDELIRERELAKREYEDLDRRLNTSSMSTALVNHQQGERLEQLDPPSLPQTPSEPKRPLIIAIGTGVGLLLGLCLAGAREVKDTALKNLKDVRAYTQLPVLGSIPLLENDLVVRRRRRLAWLAWSTACLVGVVIMSSSVVYYYATKL